MRLQDFRNNWMVLYAIIAIIMIAAIIYGIWYNQQELEIMRTAAENGGQVIFGRFRGGY